MEKSEYHLQICGKINHANFKEFLNIHILEHDSLIIINDLTNKKSKYDYIISLTESELICARLSCTLFAINKIS